MGDNLFSKSMRAQARLVSTRPGGVLRIASRHAASVGQAGSVTFARGSVGATTTGPEEQPVSSSSNESFEASFTVRPYVLCDVQ